MLRYKYRVGVHADGKPNRFGDLLLMHRLQNTVDNLLAENVRKQCRINHENARIEASPSKIFGEYVFGMKQLKDGLPSPFYEDLQKQIITGKPLSPEVADAIAHAVKVWAMKNNATHFTHWFQPLTGLTAEKHDSFLSMDFKTYDGRLESTPIDKFSGGQLIQAEPDASSFPNGGSRNTFEARGYTVWDTTSPMFIRKAQNGTAVLYIPSIFISYHGEALDEKTVLLRSANRLSNSSLRILRMFGDNETKRVHVNLGVEQEFFMIDRSLYYQRQDLKQCGRTLFGASSAKTQQLEDHYFGQIPQRVLSALSDAEENLLRLGVPFKTRHNEVAPAQFEMAPIFEEVHLANDHNLLTMSVLSSSAKKYNLKALFHEKPFKNVNGSGKHCNWSLSTNAGVNLLEPGRNPIENVLFLCFLVAILRAIHRYAPLLRSSIASSSNEHRLGSHEAPPGIISVFLGSQLDDVLNSIEEGTPFSRPDTPSPIKINVGSPAIDVKVASFPPISKDSTDRNRTSPFAFTGNKFEFRAVGSKQSPSFPMTILNSAVSSALNELADELEPIFADLGQAPLTMKNIYPVLQKYISATKNIRFEGNGYSADWIKEAERRGLPNISSAPQAFAVLQSQLAINLLVDSEQVFSANELNSRYKVMAERYIQDMLIESKNIKSLYETTIFPAVMEFKKKLIDFLMISNVSKGSKCPEQNMFEKVNELSLQAHATNDDLGQQIETLEAAEEHGLDSMLKRAHGLSEPMNRLRYFVDQLEELCPNNSWPLPKYSEMFFYL